MEISLETMPTIETGNGVRRDAVVVAGVVLAVLALGDVDAAGAAADDDAEVGRVGVEPGVAQGFARGEHGNARDLRVAPRIGAPVRPRVIAAAASPASAASSAAVGNRRDDTARQLATCRTR